MNGKPLGKSSGRDSGGKQNFDGFFASGQGENLDFFGILYDVAICIELGICAVIGAEFIEPMADELVGIGLTLGEFSYLGEAVEIAFAGSAHTQVAFHIGILDACVGARCVDGLALNGQAGVFGAKLTDEAVFGGVQVIALLGEISRDGQGVVDGVIVVGCDVLHDGVLLIFLSFVSVVSLSTL